ncbi:DNA/RNA non-specific endonuclease [Hungatella hathewayi]|uniref:DNA/RNA non-specific endonuclease n=1 Tax=Hungatella hathewayi TaxID=154046 RepID=UPI00356781E7
MNKIKRLFLPIIVMLLMATGCSPESSSAKISPVIKDSVTTATEKSVNDLNIVQNQNNIDIPGYNGAAYVPINNNIPFFSADEDTSQSFEIYSDLDNLGRCGTAYANVGTDLMPTEKRGSIGQVKPTGWHTVKYDNVDGEYLYNRCHLIGYQLTAENANEKNLITGTRYMNVDGMLPFENMVADYIKETDNHVLYRVTPIYEGNNLVASGVLMEAKSVEDGGDGILYNVFVYNIQPGITIDYATGDSSLAENSNQSSIQETQNSEVEGTYILNTNSHKFHRENCSSVSKMKSSNKESFTGTRGDLISQGYEPCGICKP